MYNGVERTYFLLQEGVFMRFGEIFKTALYKFSNYPSLLLVSNFKTTLYIFFLALIMIVGINVSVAPFFAAQGGIAAIAERELPDFAIKDGKLTCKKVVVDDKESSMYILVDDTKEGQIPLPDDYMQAVTISKTDLLIRNNYQVNSMKLSEIGDLSMADVVAWLNDKKILLIAVCELFLLFAFAFSLALNMLVTAVIAKAANLLFIRSSLRFGEIYKLSVFSMTLSVILNVIFTSFRLGAFSMIAPFITMFYLVKGMLACRKGDGMVIEVLE